MSARYALYFSPPAHSELAAFGEFCLGRTAFTGRESTATSTYKDQKLWRTLTSKPAHYGFHATLKAPFELSRESNMEQLIDTARTFASKETSVPLSGLAPRQLSHFLALTVQEQPDTLISLAQRCVEAFDSFRQPLSDADIQHRLKQPLNDRQKILLERFGYPYVAEQFRFHMTLSGEMSVQDNDFVEWAKEAYQRIVTSTPELDRIALFMQADRHSPFIHMADFPFE